MKGPKWIEYGQNYLYIFTITYFVCYVFKDGYWNGDILGGVYSFLLLTPVYFIFYVFRFPLNLRLFLWLPILLISVLYDNIHPYQIILPILLYFLSVPIIYIYLAKVKGVDISFKLPCLFRIMVESLKSSGSNCANAMEQLPKIITLISLFSFIYEKFKNQWYFEDQQLFTLMGTYGLLFLYAYLLHQYSNQMYKIPETIKPLSLDFIKREPPLKNHKWILFIIEGLGMDAFRKARAPYLQHLEKTGATFVNFYAPRDLGINSFLKLINLKGHVVTQEVNKQTIPSNIADTIIYHLTDPLDITYGYGVGLEYDQTILKLDKKIKNVISVLDKSCAYTLLFTSIHGLSEGLCSHGYGKMEERHVPLFMSGAYIKAGKVETNVVDIYFIEKLFNEIRQEVNYNLKNDVPQFELGILNYDNEEKSIL